jgi:hypothetical protein
MPYLLVDTGKKEKRKKHEFSKSPNIIDVNREPASPDVRAEQTLTRHQTGEYRSITAAKYLKIDRPQSASEIKSNIYKNSPLHRSHISF